MLGLAFVPDGKTLATASEDKTGRLLDVNGKGLKERAILKGHSLRVNTVGFSPDGQLLATASGDASVRLWDAATGKERAAFFTEGRESHAAAFSPDGKTLVGVGYGPVLLWDPSCARNGLG